MKQKTRLEIMDEIVKPRVLENPVGDKQVETH
jgi:hypothetical protein